MARHPDVTMSHKKQTLKLLTKFLPKVRIQSPHLASRGFCFAHRHGLLHSYIFLSLLYALLINYDRGVSQAKKILLKDRAVIEFSHHQQMHV